MERLSDLDWLKDMRIVKIHNKDEKTHVQYKMKKRENNFIKIKYTLNVLRIFD
jgi:hypothetical protein